MSMNDPISDMLTRMRNAQHARHSRVLFPASKFKLAILQVLQKEGFIENFELQEADKKGTIKVQLRYFEGKAVIQEIRRCSRPGLRAYCSVAEIPSVRAGLGVAIVSTSKGVMTGVQAARLKLGGELICTVA